MSAVISANTERIARMRVELERALETEAIEIIDDSHLHSTHAGAREGKGHFRVRVVARAFDGLRTLQRHQLIYRALGDLMHTDIHALGIVALTPDEARAAG